jgi:recombination protein RecA
MAETKAALKEASAKDAKAKDAALDAAVTQIEREFGAGSVMKLGDQSALKVEAISTGALSLDLALGVGGVPRGRIVEIFGPESSGKTTLIYHIIAEAQAKGGICAFVDAEHAIDPIYARRIGVDTDELLVSQPDYGEQALEIVDVLVRSGAVDVVAIDSVAALTPRAELEGQMGETQVGLQARLMSQALRKLAGNLNRANTICLFTNQIREKIGIQFGSPETQPGGRALKFYSSQRLDLRRIETLKEGTEAVGNRVPSSPTASCGSDRGGTTPSSTWPRTRSWPTRSRPRCWRRWASSEMPSRRPISHRLRSRIRLQRSPQRRRRRPSSADPR